MHRYIADHLLTMSTEDISPISPGIVDVAAGRIAWSGPAPEAPSRTGLTTHRIAGILMPGMINTHCHTPMVLLRGMGDGLPTDRWLREIMWPREARLTPEDVRAGMRMGAAELLLNGVTTSVEMYFYPQSIAEAADEIGLRCTIAAPVIDQAQLAGYGSWETQLDEALEIRAAWAASDRIVIALGPHDPTLPEACLRQVASTAQETGMLIHMHVAEDRANVAAMHQLSRGSTPAYLESIGILDADFLAAHAVWMTDDDLTMFARNGVSVAHCPVSNTKGAAGVARVVDMQAAGINVTIATDGPASHHRLDLFEEMRMAIRLARVTSGDADDFPAARALRMVTADAADAIGRPDLGRLVVGSRADMVAIAGSTPALNPVVPGEDDPISRIVWSGSPAAISAVWVAGDKVVDQGAMTRVDLPQLTAELTAAATRLAG